MGQSDRESQRDDEYEGGAAESAVRVSGAAALPPHFPDPDADKIAILEARCVELDEQLAEAHKEAKAWQAQLEAALAKVDRMEVLALKHLRERDEARVDAIALGEKLNYLGHAA